MIDIGIDPHKTSIPPQPIDSTGQNRDPGPAREYYLKKTAEGKTPREARRALKRRLSNVLYRRILQDDHQAQ